MKTNSHAVSLFGFISISLVLSLAACQTSINGRSVTKSSDADGYPHPSPFVEDQIDRKLAEVPYLRGKQVVDACASIAQIGPAAIPKLETAASDKEPMRRAFAMNVLGAIGDRRTLTILHKCLSDGDPAVRYEAARSCARMGDWGYGMPVLIEGLRDDSFVARSLCFDALHRQTNLEFGFNPKGADPERAAAVAKWVAWWQGHKEATLEMRR